jgi:YVTN family beta-propeller protein
VNELSNTVSVIATATNTVIATIPVGIDPFGVGVSPDGSKVFVANFYSSTVSVIGTATNTVTATVPVGNGTVAFGVFIQPPLPQSAPTSGSLCNGVYDGTFNGNITVSAGQNCAFLNGGQITGNVTMTGGNFVLNGSICSSMAAEPSPSAPIATIGVNLTTRTFRRVVPAIRCAARRSSAT